MRALLIFTLGATMSVAAPALADDAALRMFLGSPDRMGTPAELRQLDGDGSALRAIAANPRETRYLRLRAASWLALYDRADVRVALANLADAAGEDVEVRAQALHAIALLDGPRAVERLTRALASGERVLRETAVIDLTRVGTPAAKAALGRHRAIERDPVIRDRIQRSLP